MKNRHLRFLALGTFAVGAVLLPSTACYAAEGGGSHYVQGTRGEFAMAMIGPPGFYTRNELTYMDGDIGAVTRGDFALRELEQEVWLNTVKIIWFPEGEIFGARPGFVLSVPYVLNVDVSGSVIHPAEYSTSGSKDGFSDPSLTGFLNWTYRDSNHFSAGISVYSNFGKYDSDSIINLGRNYWSYDPYVAYTYLNPENGREFSMNAGLMFNAENESTSYDTGTEFHIDLTLAQHLPNSLTVGVVGFYYDQIQDDEGDLIGALPVGYKGFRSDSYGAGLALSWVPKIAGKDLTLTGKWIHDFDATNRLESEFFQFAVALKF
ncbi:MAG: transporter [Verrucomicrobiales bacterium]|nr:transporter [Verrucomicrobiales bacterium]